MEAAFFIRDGFETSLVHNPDTHETNQVCDMLN